MRNGVGQMGDLTDRIAGIGVIQRDARRAAGLVDRRIDAVLETARPPSTPTAPCRPASASCLQTWVVARTTVAGCMRNIGSFGNSRISVPSSFISRITGSRPSFLSPSLVQNRCQCQRDSGSLPGQGCRSPSRPCRHGLPSAFFSVTTDSSSGVLVSFCIHGDFRGVETRRIVVGAVIAEQVILVARALRRSRCRRCPERGAADQRAMRQRGFTDEAGENPSAFAVSLPEDVVGELVQPASIRAGTSAANREFDGASHDCQPGDENAF